MVRMIITQYNVDVVVSQMKKRFFLHDLIKLQRMKSRQKPQERNQGTPVIESIITVSAVNDLISYTQ